MNCKKEQIIRKAYTRKAYTRKDGTYVKETKVKKLCIKDQGKKGKGPEIIPKLEKGDLKSFGYSSKNNDKSRHIAINKAVKKYGKDSVIRKLNAVGILTKNTNPKVSLIFHKDMIYVANKK